MLPSQRSRLRLPLLIAVASVSLVPGGPVFGKWQIENFAQQAGMIRRLVASKGSRVVQQLVAEQTRYGAGTPGLVPREVSAHSAVIWYDAASHRTAGSAGFSCAAWRTCRIPAFAQTAVRRGAAAACDSVHSWGPSPQHAAELAIATEALATRDQIRLSAALQSVRHQSSLTGPPPSIQHRPQHASKAEDDAAPSGLPFDNYSHDGDRHAAAQQLSEQLEDVHGPPAPAADAVDLQSPGTRSAHSVAEAAALLQVSVPHISCSQIRYFNRCMLPWRCAAVCGKRPLSSVHRRRGFMLLMPCLMTCSPCCAAASERGAAAGEAEPAVAGPAAHGLLGAALAVHRLVSLF